MSKQFHKEYDYGMNRRIKLLFAIMAIAINVSVMAISAGAQTADAPASTNSTWKTHTAFDGQISKIIEGDRYVYVFAHQAYYHKNNSWNIYNTSRGTVLYLDKQASDKRIRGLFDTYDSSGGSVRVLNYNPRTASLWICYDNGSIDVFEESGIVHPVKNLTNPARMLMGQIITVSFDLNDDAWIAFDKGYARIDGKTFELKEWAYMDARIESICLIGKRVVAIIDNAFYEASEDSDRTMMSSFRKHSELSVSTANRILPISADSFVTLIDGSKLSLVSWNKEHLVLTTKITDATFSDQLCAKISNISDGNKYCYRGIVVDQYENNFVPVKNGYLAFSASSAHFLALNSSYDSLDIQSYKFPVTSPRYVGTLDFDDFWFYERRQGFYSRATYNHGASWEGAGQKIQWQGPVGMLLTDMAYSPKQGVLVMNKYSTPRDFLAFNGYGLMLLSGYKGGQWTNYSPIYGTPRSLSGNSSLTSMFSNESSTPYPIHGPTGFVVDPEHPEYVLVSSFGRGIIAMNTSDTEGQILRFTDSKDNYKAFPGYMETFPLSSDGNRDSLCEIIGTDSNGVIWASSIDIMNYVATGGGVMMLYWKPDSRNKAMESQDISKAGNWGRIFFPVKELINPLSLRSGDGVALKHIKNRNKIVVICNNTNSKGILICDHNGTLEDTSDDKATFIYKVKTPEGLIHYEEYMMDVTEDPLTGNLWMTFDSKLVSIDPSKPVENGVIEGEPLYVTNMDGSSESTVMSDFVHCIAFDEYNRMWVGTGNGGVYGISTDRKKMFAHYDMSNSPLKSNQIDGLCWDPESHELMIGSNMGLLSVKPDRTRATVQGIANPMAYPVNVLPEYKGTVKFVNLPVQTVLTVCDDTGRHIKQLPAVDNGQTVWDVCDTDGQPVPQGVYTVRDVARQVNEFRIIVTR